MARVAHLTTVHNPRDNRIFNKECTVLAEAGVDTWLVCPQQGDVVENGVHTVGIPKQTNRIKRLTLAQLHAWKALGRVKPDVVHVHDPELIPMTLLWKTIHRKKAIFDAHEDLVGQLDGKVYLNKYLKPLAKAYATTLTRLADKGFDGIVTATPTIAKLFTNRNTAVVRNYPRLSDYSDIPEVERVPGRVAYVGMLSKGRQVDVMVDSITQVPESSLVVAGEPLAEVAHFFTDLPADGQIDFRGRIPIQQVPELLASAQVGFSFFLPLRNYVEALPTKCFEYMAAGVPFICTDLPFMRDLFGDTDCAVFVDTSKNADEAAQALRELLADDERREQMGRNGRRAIDSTFNFEAEVQNLVGLVNTIAA